MAQTKQTERIEIQIWHGKDTFIKKSQGKIVAGFVDFKESDPAEPVIFLGQKAYTTYNGTSKKMMLYYDRVSKMLFKPSEMGNANARADMMTQTAKNVIMAGRGAQEALGIADATSTAYKFALAMIVVLAIIGCVFIYLLTTHNYGLAGQAASNAVTSPSKIGIGGLAVNVSPST